MNIHTAIGSSEAVLSPNNGSIAYMTGLENSFAIEAMAGALPIAHNSPGRCYSTIRIRRSTPFASASDTPGTANVDFVIFPERWVVMENSFHPPWYHMNVVSEFMGLIYGIYDAKSGGFVPGGMTLHNALIPHGPDAEAFEKASNKPLHPEKLSGTMAFTFETRFPLIPTAYASSLELIDSEYPNCWDTIERKFNID